jgi:hypothetical protein
MTSFLKPVKIFPVAYYLLKRSVTMDKKFIAYAFSLMMAAYAVITLTQKLDAE